MLLETLTDRLWLCWPSDLPKHIDLEIENMNEHEIGRHN